MTVPLRPTLVWAVLLVALGVPMGLTLASPYMAYRDAVYVLGGLSGVVALCLLLPQALLIAGLLPIPVPRARRLHRWTGTMVTVSVALHLAGLWITSPQDMADALLFRAPTLFSLWGVLALWALVATTVVALARWRLPLRLGRNLHGGLSALFVAGSIAHALPIIGTMEPVSKALLCMMIASATCAALVVRLWKRPTP